MDSKKILKGMTEIEDKYIEEASQGHSDRTVVRTKAAGKKKLGWKGWSGVAVAALALVVGIGGISGGWFGGYGAKSSGRYMAQDSSSAGGWNSGYKSEESYNEWVSEAEVPQDWAESEPVYAEDKSIASN